MDNWTTFRIPRALWHAQLSNFDWNACSPRKFKAAVEGFVERAVGGGAPHLILTGQCGVGKSHAGVGIYRALAAQFGTEVAAWFNVPKFCEQVKRSYGHGESDPWYEVEAATRLVVLDDLFGRDLSHHEAANVVYRLIDTAHGNGAAIVATMNQDVQDLTARLPSHEVSRLLADATIVPLVGKDRRMT